MSGTRLLFHAKIVLAAQGLGLLVSLTTCQQNRTSTSLELPYFNSPDFTPIWLTDADSVNVKITHRIADFSFQDQSGQTVTQRTVADKIYVANFFFTACPGICPKMTNLLKAVQDTFRNERRVALLSFSVTPWIDSIPRLQRYAANQGVLAHKWHLLTGARGAIYTLARQSYFAEEAIGFTKDSTEFLHTEHMILVDQNRRIRGVYNGTLPLDVDNLIADMKKLLEK